MKEGQNSPSAKEGEPLIELNRKKTSQELRLRLNPKCHHTGGGNRKKSRKRKKERRPVWQSKAKSETCSIIICLNFSRAKHRRVPLTNTVLKKQKEEEKRITVNYSHPRISLLKLVLIGKGARIPFAAHFRSPLSGLFDDGAQATWTTVAAPGDVFATASHVGRHRGVGVWSSVIGACRG